VARREGSLDGHKPDTPKQPRPPARQARDLQAHRGAAWRSQLPARAKRTRTARRGATRRIASRFVLPAAAGRIASSTQIWASQGSEHRAQPRI